MATFCQKLTDVNVYPYIPQLGPTVVPPVLTGAEGEYCVGSFLVYLNYNLDLTGGNRTGDLDVGATYYASGKNEDGKIVLVHWMTCITAGDRPTFGLTRGLLDSSTATPQVSSADLSPYFTIAEVEDITVVQQGLPDEPLEIILVENARGALIGTRIGTPHLTGFRIESERLSKELHVGEHRLSVNGKEVKSGKSIGLGNLTCVDAGNPSILLQEFDPR